MNVIKLFDLTGCTSIVTGGGRGLGMAMAEALAEAGSNIVVCSRKEEACRTAAEKLHQLGVRALGVGCDITREEDVDALLKTTLESFGRVDVLVNNSGATWGSTVEEYPLKGWRKVIDVNVTGTFICSQIIGRYMIEVGGGSIINISSIFGGVGAPSSVMDAIAYNTSKGALESFTKDLAVKWARYNIRVNNIAPAFIETKMTQATMEQRGRDILNHVPLGRFGHTDDMKGAVVFLASKASDYVTGTTLLVDGGYRAM